MTATLHTVGTKKLRADRFVKHPFTKKKLRVLDEFAPTSPVTCPLCKTDRVENITVIESEYRGGVRYHVLFCGECKKSNWFLLHGQ